MKNAKMMNLKKCQYHEILVRFEWVTTLQRHSAEG